MTHIVNPLTTNWRISWIFTKEEWRHFERWNARRKGLLNYLWYSLFSSKDCYVSSVQITERCVKIGEKRKFFSGPVTELKRVDIDDQKGVNIMTITYQILSKNRLNQIRLPIPKGKLKQAIEVQEKLLNHVM